MRAHGVGAVASLVFLVSAVAWAGPAEDAARESTRKATVAYNLGSYEEAARHYEAAYRLVQDPVLLFNLGQSWRLGGQPERALAAYRSYLRTAPAGAQNRELVERRIEELEAIVVASRQSQVAPPPHPLALSESPAPSIATTVPAEPRRPVYQRWWFWTGVGAVVAAAAVSAVVLSSGGGTNTPTTPLGNQPLFR
jgi:tetratricopeptide (TPR) repeat protein